MTTSGKLEPGHKRPFSWNNRPDGVIPKDYGGDTGSAARFFYVAKASRSERGDGNTHPTVKPIALMEYLIKLVTPAGALILDPFAGSGTTLLAARNLGRAYIGCDITPEYVEIARRRLGEAYTPDMFEKAAGD